MTERSDNDDEPTSVDRVGVIGGVAELAAHVVGVIARVFVR
ncbi:hypothetical protein [Nocardioides sp.]|nr:hypothetical protein [Nocardioides sp.]HXH77590.1 hypothetical protein [Nocardioides sp.]